MKEFIKLARLFGVCLALAIMLGATGCSKPDDRAEMKELISQRAEIQAKIDTKVRELQQYKAVDKLFDEAEKNAVTPKPPVNPVVKTTMK